MKFISVRDIWGIERKVNPAIIGILTATAFRDEPITEITLTCEILITNEDGEEYDVAMLNVKESVDYLLRAIENAS